ncbi:hypothetical protein [Marinobacter sp. OP 3.4]|uniref:hypothetical protein n=1 Tax=Marinobacter sp. OP 3.4 TaxID=3076501 RepID=UPI002E1A4A90
MSSNRKSTTNLMAEIQTLAIAISQAGVKQVMTDFSGNTMVFSVDVYPADMDWKSTISDILKAKEWSFRVWLREDSKDVSISNLLIIRDRMDELMDLLPEGRECAA